MTREGFVKLYRSLESWEWSDDLEMVGFWIKMIMMANWEDRQWRGILIKRGSLHSSSRKLAEKFKVSHQNIRTFLSRLISTQSLTQKPTSFGTIYTIVNYDKFQNLQDQTNTRSTRNQHTINTHTKELKNKELNTPLPPTGEKSSPPDIDQQVKSVFAYWQEKLNHPKATLTPERKRKIASRLREGFAVESLKEAIDGCASSSYHQGENDTGTVYNAIGLIFRNAEKVDQFRQRLAVKPKPQRVVPLYKSEPVREISDDDRAKGLQLIRETIKKIGGK